MHSKHMLNAQTATHLSAKPKGPSTAHLSTNRQIIVKQEKLTLRIAFIAIWHRCLNGVLIDCILIICQMLFITGYIIMQPARWVFKSMHSLCVWESISGV